MLYTALGMVTGTGLVFALPYAALTMGGVLLWRRFRSAATLTITLGFAAAFVGQVLHLLGGYEYEISLVRAHSDATAFAVPHYSAFPLLARYIGQLGLWAAAVGLAWHSRQGR